ncbi:MAG: lamin tail domain-containing protein [Bacteroidales bacterium]|nr:lamin tail domain-containing protein [Bacteroidales bacterium]
MKAIRLVLIALLASLTIISCVKDELYEDKTDNPIIQASDVVINEVLSTGDPDYLELYNSSDATIDLTGYAVADNSETYVLPSGTTIDAKGYLVIECDDTNEGLHSNFKISSGGETLSLFDASNKLIDQVEVPSLADYSGLTYARIPDGSDVWEISNDTKGAANSNENKAPVITAEELTEFTEIYSIQVSDADGVASVKLILMTASSVQSLDMPLINDEYQISVPTFVLGTKVEYYVEAKDLTGKTSYYPELGYSEPNFYYITDDKPLFLSVTYEGAQAGNLGDVTFTVDAFDNDSVQEVKLYYIFPGQIADEKTSVVLSFNDSLYTGVIPLQASGTIIRYYLRAEDNDGNKTYYPLETTGGSFNHDDETTWPSYMAGEPVVINGFSMFYTTTPEDGSDLVFTVKVKYDNGGPQEVKFYYTSNYNAATYDEAIDRFDIVWAGALPTGDDMYTFTIPAADFSSGDAISWYFRAKDGNGDKMYFTDGKGEEFDGVMKDDPATWNVIVIP